MTLKPNGVLVIICAFLFCAICGLYITVYSGSTLSNSPLAIWAKHNESVQCQNSTTQMRQSSLRLPTCSTTDRSPEVKLLIVTYMRSGSTFTGDLFDQHPDVFYVFEPLRAEDKFTVEFHQTAWFWNKPSTKVRASDKEATAKFQDGIVRGFLNCSLEDIDIKSLVDPFMKFGMKTRLFDQCRHGNQGILGTFRCLPVLERSCCQSKVVASKTIRYTMARALTLMADDPKVKVIHLVRDPRGTLYSRLKYGKLSKSTLEEGAKQQCEDVESDLKVGREAMKRFPGRILRVRYEDFALEPFRFAEKLLRFADLKMTAKQKEHLGRITNASGKQCAQCVKVLQTNSSYNAFAWRQQIQLDDLSKIERHCGKVYKLAGYLPLSVDDPVRNMSVPSLLKPSKVLRFLS